MIRLLVAVSITFAVMLFVAGAVPWPWGIGAGWIIGSWLFPTILFGESVDPFR